MTTKILVLMNEYTPEALERRKKVVEASVSDGVEVGYAVIKGSGGGKAVTNLHRTGGCAGGGQGRCRRREGRL